MIEAPGQPDSPAMPRPARRRRRAWQGAIVGIIILLAGSAGLFVWQRQQAYHFAVVQPGVLYRDGARSSAQFAAALDRVHPKTVVSLVDADEMADANRPQLSHEADLCAAHGARLERIQVKLGGWPDTADVQRFLATVSDPANQPVLVHCAQGVRRTAMFVAAYQESVLGYDRAAAQRAILTFGHSERTIDDIRRFIDRYDPATRTVKPE